MGFVHRFFPHDVSDPGVTLLVLHGTGGDENNLVSLGRELAPGAAILSPRGKVSEYGAPRFFRRLAEGVFDHEDLVFRTHELADFIEAAAKEYGFDLSR
ncbi:MAG: alpha/beta hydrolase, partial [Actinomycetota bacterium]|nr:alpha/beta hydrolase [Actinomycetota bacterium]